MDLLFVAKSPWVWTAEANFQALMAENANIGTARRPAYRVTEVEKGIDADIKYKEAVSNH